VYTLPQIPKEKKKKKNVCNNWRNYVREKTRFRFRFSQDPKTDFILTIIIRWVFNPKIRNSLIKFKGVIEFCFLILSETSRYPRNGYTFFWHFDEMRSTHELQLCITQRISKFKWYKNGYLSLNGLHTINVTSQAILCMHAS
jgi:hypothetical protein